MGLQDRDYLKDLKPQPDETGRGHPRRNRQPTPQPDMPQWLHIAFGIVVAALVLWGGREAYFRYQVYQIAQAAEQAAREFQQEQQLRAIQAQEHARATEQQRQYYKQYNSPQCVFWRHEAAKNGTHKALGKVLEHCP